MVEWILVLMLGLLLGYTGGFFHALAIANHQARRERERSEAKPAPQEPQPPEGPRYSYDAKVRHSVRRY